MNQDTKEINLIKFGIYSSEEILKMSVCKLDNSKKVGIGSVYDPRMGPTDNNDCETCHESSEICPGHFGHIELNEEIIHPLYYKNVMQFLKCFCKECHKMIISKEHIYLNGLNRYKGRRRFEKILLLLEKINICCHEDCNSDQPVIRFNPVDSNISMVYIDKKKQKTSVVLNIIDIKKIFDDISNEDIELLGFNPELIHPRSFILSVLPVIPPADRPFVKADGNICDDDLTNQLCEIIKANSQLEKIDGVPVPETKRQKYIQSLKFRILTMFNNSKGKAKHTTNGRPLKCIKDRITGKDGQIRNNIMGKRVNQSARTVIGPEPNLKFGQIAVPILMSKILTVPESVTPFNIEKLNKYINSEKANFVINKKGVHINLKRYRAGSNLLEGDVIHREGKYINVSGLNLAKEKLIEGDKIWRKDAFVKNIKYPGREYKLKIGDVVERHLDDGDIVLLNRQPTLHKASMQAMEVVIRPCKTIRMNLAITKPFNADFDGDEMNLHIPQTLEAQTELRMLSAAKHNIISAQSSKPNVAIVQDSLLGAYRMTKGIQKIKKGQFFNICMKIEKFETESVLDRIQHIRKVLKSKGKKASCFNGKGLVSLILPKDFIYEKKNNADSQEPIVKIYKGVLYEGTLDKNILGSSHNAIIQVLHKEYNNHIAAEFIDNIQFITNNWLLISGFSVGIKDCMIDNIPNEEGITKQQQIQDVIQKCFIEADTIQNSTSHHAIRELRINAALGKAKDIGLRIAKEALEKDNNFLSTVGSGSKGDFFNIAQITGLLGQQNLRGSRIQPTLNNGKRSLPHYPFPGQMTREMEYESKGFISSSFIGGLNPREFFFHAMSGREGISDTAMGTATSGYMQRRIVKLTEDIKIQYDGTVRDTNGRIFQMAYGDDCFDPANTIKVNNKQEECDVSQIVNKLNMKHEMNIKSNKKRTKRKCNSNK